MIPGVKVQALTLQAESLAEALQVIFSGENRRASEIPANQDRGDTEIC